MHSIHVKGKGKKGDKVSTRFPMCVNHRLRMTTLKEVRKPPVRKLKLRRKSTCGLVEFEVPLRHSVY